MPPAERLTVDELNGCRLTRTQLEKWADQPFFERTLPGLFVRVGTYRILSGSILKQARNRRVQVGQRACVSRVRNRRSEGRTSHLRAGLKENKQGASRLHDFTLTAFIADAPS